MALGKGNHGKGGMRASRPFACQGKRLQPDFREIAGGRHTWGGEGVRLAGEWLKKVARDGGFQCDLPGINKS